MINSHMKKRYSLGTLVGNTTSLNIGLIIGTWRWDAMLGRQYTIGSDPKADEAANGYLCLPHGNRCGYFYFLFSNVILVSLEKSVITNC